jgi:SAM-dependent methyltransferase
MPELLACPLCAGPLQNEGARLRCGCAAWPVVAEIPVLLPWARNQSLTVGDLLARHRPPAEGFADKILRRLVPGAGALEKVISRRDATFLELAAELGRTRDLDYFRYRFSDLSYLATAALLTPLVRGPLLDLGCGAGHGIHAIFRRVPRSLAVGVDANFTLLYLAKRFVAPTALFVCADASTRLPFRDGAFEAALSADTFQYLPDGAATARELLRITRGPLLLSHFYRPEAGGSFDARAALKVFADRSPRLHDEDAILEAFLARRELDLSRPAPEHDGVVTLTAGLEPKIHPGADYFVSGSALNPLYEVREEGGTLHLQRRLLSEQHAERYRKYEAWLPETLTVTREQIASADPEFVRKFVLLDLPPNYC